MNQVSLRKGLPFEVVLPEKEALKNYWKDDFKGIYASLDETIDACSQFIENIVFTISLI